MEWAIPISLKWDENFDVGPNTGTQIDDRDDNVPFRLDGGLDELTLIIDRPRLSPEDVKKLEAMRDAHPASEERFY